MAAARALIGQPELVIADEPTSALDYDARENFIRLLFAECREAGSSLLFVSHDQSLAPLFDRNLSLAELNRAATPSEDLEMYLFRLAMASLANRRFTALLTAFAIALSVCLLLAVERVRTEAKASFASTISGTDLIVGARSGSVNLLLYLSVFRIGNATNNIRWDSFEHFANNPKVKWAIPMSLGDSHRGYRVMGTTEAYFEHYQYGHQQHLQLADGRAFATDPFEVVLGAEVADALHYKLGDQLVLAHGVAAISLVKHDDKPFTVVGILERTGTPVDRTLHISLGGMEAIHVDWNNGVPAQGKSRISADQARNMDLTPQAITAFMLGLNSKISTFAMQREINEFRGEPMLAILPGAWRCKNCGV